MNSQPKCCDLRDCGISVLRIVVGVVFVVHGYQKLHHFGQTVDMFTTKMGLPAPVAYYAIFAEPIGGALLVLGLLTRVGALLIAGVMAGAIVKVHGKNGFFLPAGYEYVLVLFGACVTLLLAGSGSLAIDNLLFRRARTEGRGIAAEPPPPTTR